MTKIAILGGAFDPVTNGHIDICNYLTETNIVDEVWLSPCYLSYYDKKMANENDRLEMCNVAVAENKNIRVKVTDFEIANKMVGESIDILASFITAYPEHKFHFVIGMDNAIKINTWSKWTELIGLLPFIIFPRGDSKMPTDNLWFMNSPHIYMSEYVENKLSSTQVRDDIKNGIESKMICNSVNNYIKTFGVYASSILYLYTQYKTNFRICKIDVFDKSIKIDHNTTNILYSAYVINKDIKDIVIKKFTKLFKTKPELEPNTFEGDYNDMIYELMRMLKNTKKSE